MYLAGSAHKQLLYLRLRSMPIRMRGGLMTKAEFTDAEIDRIDKWVMETLQDQLDAFAADLKKNPNPPVRKCRVRGAKTQFVR